MTKGAGTPLVDRLRGVWRFLGLENIAYEGNNFLHESSKVQAVGVKKSPGSMFQLSQIFVVQSIKQKQSNDVRRDRNA